jgi:hypothetical protein
MDQEICLCQLPCGHYYALGGPRYRKDFRRPHDSVHASEQQKKYFNGAQMEYHWTAGGKLRPGNQGMQQCLLP